MAKMPDGAVTTIQNLRDGYNGISKITTTGKTMYVHDDKTVLPLFIIGHILPQGAELLPIGVKYFKSKTAF